jgi:hypothetical protein
LRKRSARLLGGRERRAALALRIALLSRSLSSSAQTQEISHEPENLTQKAKEEVHHSTTIAPPASAPSTKRRTPPPDRPAIAVKDAASLLAALETTQDENWSNPDWDASGKAMEMSAPTENLGGGARDLPDLSLETSKTRRDPAPAAPPAITITDLSLSILTGEFKPSPPPSQISTEADDDPGAVIEEDPNEGGSTVHRLQSSRILEDEAISLNEDLQTGTTSDATPLRKKAKAPAKPKSKATKEGAPRKTRRAKT